MANWTESQAIAAREFLEGELGTLLDEKEKQTIETWKQSLDPVVRENCWNYIAALTRLKNELKSIANSTEVEQLNNLNLTE